MLLVEDEPVEVWWQDLGGGAIDGSFHKQLLQSTGKLDIFLALLFIVQLLFAKIFNVCGLRRRGGDPPVPWGSGRWLEGPRHGGRGRKN